MKLVCLFSAMLICLASGTSAFGGFLFRAADTGGAFSNSIVVAPSGGVVNLFLIEDGNIPFLANTATFVLNGVGSGTSIGSISTANFDTKSVVGLTFSNSAFQSTVNSVSLNGVQAIQVGSINFSGTVGQFTTFRFADLNGGSQIILNNNAFNSDAAVFGGSSTFTVTAVPEPSTIALLGLVSVGGLIARRFRRKKLITV